MRHAATSKPGILNQALDFCAMGLSGLCVVHCLLLPLLVAFLPLAAELADSEWIHKAILLVAIPMSALAALRSTGTEYFRIFVTLAAIGLSLLTLAAFLPLTENREVAITLAGALFLSLAHLWRWVRHKRDCAHSCG